MVILDTATVTKTRRRELSDVQLIFRDDDTLEIRGTLTVTTLEGSNVVRRRSLATITLVGADLATALSAANLPAPGVIKTRFQNLFHSAWTAKLGTINAQGTESD